MTWNVHDGIRELIVLGDGISGEQQSKLRTHLQMCAACSDYADAAQGAVQWLRTQPLTADSELVRATQMRVRARSLELRQQQERLWIVCVCSIAVTLGTTFTTAVLWRGFAWIGQQIRLASIVWQLGLLAVILMPAIVAAVLLLAQGTCLTQPDDHFRTELHAKGRAS